VVLHAAHRELTKLSASRDLDRFTRQVRAHYADLICHGLWFTPFREALDAFVDKVQERVTGEVSSAFKGFEPYESPPPRATRPPTIASRSPPTDAVDAD
jgi:argininosuccinate synthase